MSGKFCAFTLSALVLSSTSASAFEATFVEDARPTRIQIAPFPGADSKNRFLVVWDNLGEEPTHGALIYSADKEVAETRYFAVGGDGPFAIVDQHAFIRSGGSDVPAVNVVVNDPAHPRIMKTSKDRPAVPELLATYRKEQGMEGSTETKAAIQTSVNAAIARFNSRCGAKASATVSWPQFERKNVLSVAADAAAVISGVSDACGESAYKAEVAKISSFVIGYNEGGKDLSFKKSGNSIDAKLHAMDANPRQQAHHWIIKEL